MIDHPLDQKDIDLDLHGIAMRHVQHLKFKGYCDECGDAWPCDTAIMVAAVERLKAENAAVLARAEAAESDWQQAEAALARVQQRIASMATSKSNAVRAWAGDLSADLRKLAGPIDQERTI